MNNIEDIEYLEDIIKILRDKPKENENAFMELSANSQRELAQAIENLIKAYKELEENCKKCVVRERLNKYVENSISKDKIREYKEILNNKLDKYKITVDNKEYICKSNLSEEEKELINNIIVQIATLEELLEEE